MHLHVFTLILLSCFTCCHNPVIPFATPPIHFHPTLKTPPFHLLHYPHGLKAGQAFLGYQRYTLGSSSSLFSQDYTDPSQDPAAAPSADSEYTGYNADIEASYDATGGGYQSQN